VVTHFCHGQTSMVSGSSAGAACTHSSVYYLASWLFLGKLLGCASVVAWDGPWHYMSVVAAVYPGQIQRAIAISVQVQFRANLAETVFEQLVLFNVSVGLSAASAWSGTPDLPWDCF